MKMAESSPNGKKTLREKEKLLFTSNFSFSHSVYKRLKLHADTQNSQLVWERDKRIENIVRKSENAIYLKTF